MGGGLAASLALLLAACSDAGGTAAAGDDDDAVGSAGKKSAAAGTSGLPRGGAGKGGGPGGAGKGGASGTSGQGSPAGQGSGFPVGGAPGAGGGPGGAGGSSTGGTSAGTGTGPGGSTSAGPGGSTSAGPGGSTGTAGSGVAGQGTAGSPVVDCAGDPNVDNDGDGFSEAQGDCNDCDPNANPGAVDVITLDQNGQPSAYQADEDCDGVILQPGQDVCDQGIGIDDGDPIKGAFAMDICKVAQGTSWGIVSAQYVKINGSPLDGSGAVGHGILTHFGTTVGPQLGSSMLALSSGAARNPGEPGYQSPSGYNRNTTDGAPPGFPLESSSCPGVTTGAPHDSTALRVTLKVPTNAKSFSFKFKFYTFEYPNFICSKFNDFFTVLMDPPPADVNQINRNITFDKQNNPISVNNAFLEVCACPNGAAPPCQVGGKTFSCPAGDGDLAATGFDGADLYGQALKGQSGATVWLETKAPVTPGSTITLTFGTFDSGDGVLDSTGLVDSFRWSADPASGTSTTKP